MSAWHEKADPYDKLLAFLREMWGHLKEPAFSLLDILSLLGVMAMEARHVSQWLMVPAMFAWICLRRFW